MPSGDNDHETTMQFIARMQALPDLTERELLMLDRLVSVNDEMLALEAEARARDRQFDEEVVDGAHA